LKGSIGIDELRIKRNAAADAADANADNAADVLQKSLLSFLIEFCNN
jgi:hypothetical protein